MPRSRVSCCVVSAVLALSLAGPVRADDPQRYGLMAQSAWSAFQCAVLAEKSNNMAEQKRLFEFGYAQGLQFVAALEAGTTRREELAGAAPASMLLLLEGPTADFALGRIFEAALRSALEDVFASAASYESAELQESIAAQEFRKRNCHLIGR